MKYQIATLLLVFVFLGFVAQAQDSKKEWMLVEKEGRKKMRLKQGQNIHVVWIGLSKQITSKGNLRAFTPDSLILDIKGAQASIAQNDIVEIRAKRKPNVFRWILGITLVLTALIVTAGIVALFIVFGTEPYDTGESGAGEGLRVMVPMLSLGFIGVLLLLPNKKTIHQPFDGNWSLQEISVKPNNMP